MGTRLTPADRLTGAAAAAGIIAAFLPWSRYESGTVEITVNGFRASPLGDIFFVCAAALLVVQLVDARLLTPAPWTVRDPARCSWLAGTAATAAVAQLLLTAALGRSVAPGLVLALAAAVAMAVGAHLHRRPARSRRPSAGALDDLDHV